MNRESNHSENTRMNKIDEITEKLEAGIKDMFQGDNFKEYLKSMSKFHRYSLNNVILITSQMKDATHVASFTKWKELDRSVKKGEHGLQIFSPIIRNKLDPETKEIIINEKSGKPEKVITGYKPAYVFDISQTEGKELPEIVKVLTGKVEDFEKLKEALTKVSEVPISFEHINGRANGYYSLTEEKIVVDESLPEAQKIKTMVHEISHSMLHSNADDEKERTTKEVEAESVAYTVCNYLGLDTSDYSFGYIGGWSKDMELSELKESLSTIKDTSSRIIKKLEEYTVSYEQPSKEQVLEHTVQRAYETKSFEREAKVSETYDYELEH